MVPTANDMSDALLSACHMLHSYELIDGESLATACGTFRQLYGQSKSWKYCINASNPITFDPFYYKNAGTIVYPQIYMEIETDEKRPPNGLPAIKKLLVTLEILDVSSEIQLRCHIDTANKMETTGSSDVIHRYQEGPLYHLQYGGHSPGRSRENELKIKEPRWHHPPMDLILACETIIANFYPDKWLELKSEPNWNELIKISQGLCYKSYFQKIVQCLDANQPLLGSLWASEWGP